MAPAVPCDGNAQPSRHSYIEVAGHVVFPPHSQSSRLIADPPLNVGEQIPRPLSRSRRWSPLHEVQLSCSAIIPAFPRRSPDLCMDRVAAADRLGPFEFSRSSAETVETSSSL